MKEYTIDAKGKTIGRLATNVAILLRGKGETSYSRNTAPAIVVKIINASNLFISEKKRHDKVYTRYTGYPGGLRKARLEEVLTKKGIEEPIKLAIYGMLPNNKLRRGIMKNLIIER